MRAFSDPGSTPGISTESNSVSLELDEVGKFDLSPQNIFLGFRTSDVRIPLGGMNMDQYKSLPKAKEKYYVYTLYSLKDHNFYTGFTTDLKSRLIKHAKGLVTSTKFRTPFKLIHYEYFINIEDAKAREKFLKSGFGRKQLKEALKRTLKNI